MFTTKTHNFIYLFALCNLVFGIMLGSSPTSVAQVLLLTNWVLEGDFVRKWQQLKQNILFWILSSVFFIHLLGMFYSQDFWMAFHDLRTKLPLVLAPLVFFTSRPLKQKELHYVFYSFLLGCFFNITWCLVYSFIIQHGLSVREVSRFMSHIRLGLFLNIAIAILTYLVFEIKNKYIKIICFTLLIYFVSALFILGLASGIANFFCIAFFGIIYLFFKQKSRVKYTLVVIFIFLIGYSFLYLKDVYHQQLSIKQSLYNTKLEKSSSGNLYSHFDFVGQKENGNYVLINIQLDELKREWNKQMPTDSFCFKPQSHNLKIYEVLVRYLASKDLSKDSVGISNLSKTDKWNITHNITNFLYPDWPFIHKRLYELVNEFDEYQNGRNLNGHSLTMRLYFWKAALFIIKEHPIFGVGTGDVQSELNNTYIKTKSPLEPKWYKRPHNQFLTISVSLGLIGLFFFIFSLIYPLISLNKFLPILYWPFFILAINSFILEDTLESQAGISFFASFNTLFLCFAYFKKQQSLLD